MRGYILDRDAQVTFWVKNSDRAYFLGQSFIQFQVLRYFFGIKCGLKKKTIEKKIKKTIEKKISHKQNLK